MPQVTEYEFCYNILTMNKIDISSRSVLRIVLIPLALYLVWANKDLLFAVFMALILMSALKPVVHYLSSKKKIPRPLAALLVVVSTLVVIAFLAGAILPPIFLETLNFIERLPETLQSLNPSISKYVGVTELSQFVPTFANQVVGIVGNVFSNTFLVFITLFVSYYLLANERLIEDSLFSGLLHRHLSEKKTKELLRVVRATQDRLASWFWGQLALMFIVGIVSYLAFSWIGLKYALPLAVLAGILEALPNIGPIIAAVVTVLIGFGQTPIVGVASLAVSVVVQQVENYFLVPYIMKKAVGLNPIITMFSVVLGLRIAGPLGALLAIPTYVLLEAVYRELYPQKKPHTEDTGEIQPKSE